MKLLKVRFYMQGQRKLWKFGGWISSNCIRWPFNEFFLLQLNCSSQNLKYEVSKFLSKRLPNDNLKNHIGVLYCWGPLSAKYARLRCHSTVCSQIPLFPAVTAHFCAKRHDFFAFAVLQLKIVRSAQKCAVNGGKEGNLWKTVEWHRNRAYLAERCSPTIQQVQI